MKYAKIENNTVVQVQPYSEDGFIKVEDYITAGMIKDGDLFVNPDKTLDELKSIKSSELKVKYNEEVEKGYKYNNHKFYCSKSTLSNIAVSVDVVKDIVAQGNEPTAEDLSFDCCTLERVTFASADDFVQFKIDITRHVDRLDKNRNAIQKQINDSADEAGLDAIDLMLGW